MPIEFEATFSGIDKDAMRAKLREVGAAMVYPEFLMKRIIFNPASKSDYSWARVRQEADKITMSYKRTSGTGITSQEEIEIEINNFDSGVALMKAVGMEQKAYQETKRELWRLDNVDITLDTWPGLNPIIEIEGTNEEDVKRVVEKLGFDYNQAIFGSISIVYKKELNIPEDEINNHTPIITFENPPTLWTEN